MVDAGLLDIFSTIYRYFPLLAIINYDHPSLFVIDSTQLMH